MGKKRRKRKFGCHGLRPSSLGGGAMGKQPEMLTEWPTQHPTLQTLKKLEDAVQTRRSELFYIFFWILWGRGVAHGSLLLMD